VIWGYRRDSIYSHAWLIEHDNAIDWKKDKLERLHDVYNSQYEACSTIYQGKWLLDDNTKLETKCVSSYGGFETEVIIYEDESILFPMSPVWINPNR
jgi:hypothetical protein